MTTIDTQVTGSEAATDGFASRLAEWATTTDHKKIGRMYLVAGFAAAIAVAVVGALLGVQRAIDTVLIEAGALAQVWAGFRVGLILSVVAPIVTGIALAVVPLQLGARALAFGRAALLGCYLWLIGTVLSVICLGANGGPGGGRSTFVALYFLALILQLVGLIIAWIALTTTILTARAPGMNMRRVPVFSWSALVTGVSVLIALPIVLGLVIVGYVDYRYGRIAFDGNQGMLNLVGAAITEPMTFLWAIPAYGFALETIATASGRRLPLRGTAFAGLGLIGVATLAASANTALGIARDGFRSGFWTFVRQALPLLFFYGLPLLGALTVLGVGAMALRSKPRLQAPLVFGLLGAALVTAGIAAALVMRIGDFRLGDTVFTEAVTVLIAGGTIVAMLGAIVYWGPKLTGWTSGQAQFVPLALLGAAGVGLAGGAYVIAGFAKQPAGQVSFDYGGPQELWNYANAAGWVMIALAILGVLAMRASSWRGGVPAGDDPWDGQTLEWATSSPAPEDNFAVLHTVISPEPLIDLKPGGPV